jgi:branched-chain amino acid transport system ATP-binding protein
MNEESVDLVPGPRQKKTVLELIDVCAGYAGSRVLHNVNLAVPESSIVALVGANGAGKSTLLRVASGLLRPQSGEVVLDQKSVNRLDPYERVKRGLCLIPEGRGIFRSLTVRENLELQVPPWMSGGDIDLVLKAFPVLDQRLSQIAGSLSGGEQQMLALGRAYLSNPKVILLDEVSLGLAPLIVDKIFDSLRELAATSVALLIVEQYVHRVIEMADYAYLLNRGEVAWTGRASDLEHETILSGYLNE